MMTARMEAEQFVKNVPRILEMIGRTAKELPERQLAEVGQIAETVYEGYFLNLRTPAEFCGFILSMIYFLSKNFEKRRAQP